MLAVLLTGHDMTACVQSHTRNCYSSSLGTVPEQQQQQQTKAQIIFETAVFRMAAAAAMLPTAS
jgi:hypothetical protein